MPLRAELYCYFCGHGCGDVLVPTRARKPTPEQLRVAYASVAEPMAPVWDDAGQPNCPRCGGDVQGDERPFALTQKGELAGSPRGG